MSASNDGRTEDVVTAETAACSFESMNLPAPLVVALDRAGFLHPSPIQLKAIPSARLGTDLVVQAKSGTGKTCVFSVVALEVVMNTVSREEGNATRAGSPIALILVPTREIAIQVHDVLEALGSELPSIAIHTFIGGLPIRHDIDVLKQQPGCHIAVGTPGRVKHLIVANHLKTSFIKIFILDEADKLLSHNFCQEVTAIAENLPARKQVLAVSATYPSDVLRRVHALMARPKQVQAGGKKLENDDSSPTTNDDANAAHLDLPSLSGIRQFFWQSPSPSGGAPSANMGGQNVFAQKTQQLIAIMSTNSFHQCVVFCNLKSHAVSLVQTLNMEGWPSIGLSSHQNQADRIASIRAFRNYQYRILVSTDLTARGIDVVQVNLVINMEVPHDPETYVHRVGRAGRFGTYGFAVTLIEAKERKAIEALEDMYSMKIHQLPEDGVIGRHATSSANSQAKNGIPREKSQPGSPVVRAAISSGKRQQHDEQAMGIHPGPELLRSATLQLQQASPKELPANTCTPPAPDSKEEQSFKDGENSVATNGSTDKGMQSERENSMYDRWVLMALNGEW
jgi:ATP-dependent RNA helicase DDX20